MIRNKEKFRRYLREKLIMLGVGILCSIGLVLYMKFVVLPKMISFTADAAHNAEQAAKR